MMDDQDSSPANYMQFADPTIGFLDLVSLLWAAAFERIRPKLATRATRAEAWSLRSAFPLSNYFH